LGTGKKVPYSLYCDGTGFKFVTTWQGCEGEAGKPLPKDRFPSGGKYTVSSIRISSYKSLYHDICVADFSTIGAWYTMPGRHDPSRGPTYISSMPPKNKNDDICYDDKGNKVRAVTQIGGNLMILCPRAFDSINRIPSDDTPAVGTKLDDYKSLGASMLHEMTHMRFRTRDLPGGYGATGAKLVATIGGGMKAQRNADNWTFYALACLMKNRAWTMGYAQPLDNYGKNGPKSRREIPSEA
jgi:hypothetical protein